jgi:hypothetical protein
MAPRIAGVIAAVAVVTGTGCGAGDTVAFSGDVAGRPVRATGTVAAWVDATAFVVDEDGATVLQDRVDGDARLHLRFFELAFDPSTSFDRLSSAERATLVEELARGDVLAVDVVRGASLRDGDTIRAVGDRGVPEVLPYIERVSLALRDAGRGAASYPASLPGAVVVDDTATFDVETVAPRLQGTLRFQVVGVAATGDVGDDDGEDDITVAFSTTLLPERVAECNFDRDGAGVVDACTLAPAVP